MDRLRLVRLRTRRKEIKRELEEMRRMGSIDAKNPTPIEQAFIKELGRIERELGPENLDGSGQSGQQQ